MSANALDIIEFQATLPVLIERASRTLLDAKSSGEVLEARDMARAAYDAAKSAGRIAKARQAHDEILSAIHRAQGEASYVRARAEMRLADEIDAAQQRGELASAGGDRTKIPDGNFAPSMADVGLDNKQVHEARKLRDAEKASPGKTKAVIEDIVSRGEEPSRAKIHREVTETPAIDPERRKLGKLTPDALMDEVLGLRVDLAEAKAELAKLKAERDALKAQVKDLSATDTGATIRKLQAEADNAKNAKWREGERAIAFQKQIYALKKELKSIGATEIPL